MLARALVLTPAFLVADEPVSMLDVSVRAGILTLLRDREERLASPPSTSPMISTLVRYVCERTLVMYLGSIVEDGPTDEIIARPRSSLYAGADRGRSACRDADQSREQLPISGAIGDAREPAFRAAACAIAARYAFARCAAEEPLLREVAPGHRAACHLDDRAQI